MTRSRVRWFVGGVAVFALAWISPAQTARSVTSSAGAIQLYNDGQHVEVSRNFESPLGVTTVDQFGQPVAGVHVVLRVETGSARLVYVRGGNVGDGTEATAVSDVNGSVVAIAAAGPLPGSVVISVTATGDSVTSPQFGIATAAFSLRVDSPSWPAGVMPNTGAQSLPVAATAATLLFVGIVLVAGTRRGQPHPDSERE